MLYRLITEDETGRRPRSWRLVIFTLILLPTAISLVFFGATAGAGRHVAINVCYTVAAGLLTVVVYTYLYWLVRDVWADQLGRDVGIFTLLAWFYVLIAVGHMWLGAAWLWDPAGQWSGNVHAEVGDLDHPGRHVWWVWWRTLYTTAQIYRGGGYTPYDAIGLLSQIPGTLLSNTAVMVFAILVVGHGLTLIDRKHKGGD